jgi:hypothetical protein
VRAAFRKNARSKENEKVSNHRKNDATSDTCPTIHPLSPQDSVAITALRSVVVGMKGNLEGVAARVMQPA